jgi:hypothetical protein
MTPAALRRRYSTSATRDLAWDDIDPTRKTFERMPAG